MDANVDYPFSSYPSDVDETEDIPRTPEPNWSDPRSTRLSDVVNFSNSNMFASAVKRATNLTAKEETHRLFKCAKSKVSSIP